MPLHVTSEVGRLRRVLIHRPGREIDWIGTAVLTGGLTALVLALVEGNAWAKSAPVLMLSVAKLAFDRNGKPNRHALHDVGLAAANLTLQAQALGLSVHQMAGFHVGRAREVLAIPDGFEPVAMIAIGYRGDPDSLPDPLKERELTPRLRKQLDAFVFGSGWESPAALLNE